MNIETSDFDFTYDISNKDLQNVLILPYGVDEEFKGKKETLYTESSISVLKKLKQNDVHVDFAVGSPADSIYIENRSIEWFGPTLFFSLSLLSQNPTIVSICINVLSSYIYDIFKGKSEDPNVKCSFVLEDNKKKRKINYEGPVSGLNKVEEIVNGREG